MNYKVIGGGDLRYIEFISSDTKVGTEQDALDLISLCGGNDTNLLMIHGDALSEDFFNLKTGVAGRMLQKFVNYQMKAVLVLSDQTTIKARFRELVNESNKGSRFGVFNTKEEAEEWLMKA